MKHKIIGYALALVVLLGSFMIMKSLSGSKKVAEVKEPPVVKRSVRILEYTPSDIVVEIPVNGKLSSLNKIEIYSEVNGKVLSDGGKFREGSSYNKGEVILNIDSKDFKASMVSLKTGFQALITQILTDIKLDYSDNYSNWEKYLVDFDPERSLPSLPKPASVKEKQFLTIKNVYNQYYNIRSQEEKLEKYTIRAPFSGVLSSTATQQGSIVRPGQKLGDLIQPGIFELKVPVNVQNIKYLKAGQKVELGSEDFDGQWNGVLKRIGKSVDIQTQSISAYLEINSNSLKDGLYLRGTVKGEKLESCFSIPRKLLQKDKTIYLVEDGKLKKVTPKVLKYNESDILIAGLEEKTILLNESFVGAYEGMEVNVVK